MAVGFAFAAAGPGISAQTVVTENDFLVVLDEGRAATRALRDDLAAAEAEELRADAFENPTFSYRHEKPEESSRLTNWELEWTPPLDGRRSLRLGAAAAGREAAIFRFEGERLRLRGELRRVFAEWALAFEKRETLRRNLESIERFASRSRQRATRGEESGLDAGRLELAASEARNSLALADADFLVSEARVRAWRPDLAVDSVPSRPELKSLPDATSTEGNLDLRARRRELEQAELEQRLAGRIFRFPALTAGWQQIEEGGRSWSGPIFGFAWTIPLFDRDAAARRESLLRLQAAEARLELSTATVRAELVGATVSYRTLADAARAARETAAGTEKLIRSATAAFEAGEAGVTDLLDTLRAAFEARLRELEVLGAALDAHRRLESLSSPSTLPEETR
jgi:outer membrane protein TolC